jgi:uncharacterized membrane protein
MVVSSLGGDGPTSVDVDTGRLLIYYGYAILVGGALSLGMNMFMLEFVRRRECRFDLLLAGFANLGRAIGLMVVSGFIVACGFMALVAPGVIFACALMPVFFLLADHPNIGVFKAVATGWRMMTFNKAKLFLLIASFAGWALLAALSTLALAVVVGLFLWLTGNDGSAQIEMASWALSFCWMLALLPLTAYANTAIAIFYDMVAGNRPAGHYAGGQPWQAPPPWLGGRPGQWQAPPPPWGGGPPGSGQVPPQDARPGGGGDGWRPSLPERPCPPDENRQGRGHDSPLPPGYNPFAGARAAHGPLSSSESPPAPGDAPEDAQASPPLREAPPDAPGFAPEASSEAARDAEGSEREGGGS